MQSMSSVQFYRLALQQQVLYYNNIEETLALQEEIEDLKAKIATKHKKHRRCDKQISKGFKCPFCEKNYASDIALKLHFKLKHPKQIEEKTLGCSTEQEQAQFQQNSLEIQVRKNVAL